MTREHVGHREIAQFAQERVNLPRDKAQTYRAQAHRLRERLESFLKENPDFELCKILLSGSLAKGTALRSLNDIDMACYISGADAPSDVTELIEYLTERLQTAFPNLKSDQVQPQTYCVKVSFRGTGLDVDVVPILYDDDPDWYGNLVSQEDGSYLKTCIPRHLEFMTNRKKAQPKDFAQVVRLIKYWVANQKREKSEFRFKSFMIEMILSHLCDQHLDFSDYPEAMQHFFTYVVRSNLNEKIIFNDYYPVSKVGTFSERVQIIDPVNEENNVARLYTTSQVDTILEAAMDAGDAIDAALYASTKQETVRHWRRVLGPSFHF